MMMTIIYIILTNTKVGMIKMVITMIKMENMQKILHKIPKKITRNLRIRCKFLINLQIRGRNIYYLNILIKFNNFTYIIIFQNFLYMNEKELKDSINQYNYENPEIRVNF